MVELSKQESYSVTNAAKRLGISISTLREYEKRGLIRLFHDPVNGRSRFFNEDLKWIRHIRNLIHQEKLNIVSIQRLLAIIACWKSKNCPEAKREKCQASSDRTLPCWVMTCSKEINKCRDCKVYLQACERGKKNFLLKVGNYYC
ncbi:MAG: MerR family transcriptional regulator [bacterium]